MEFNGRQFKTTDELSGYEIPGFETKLKMNPARSWEPPGGNMRTTAHTQFCNGIPVTVPNKTIEPKITANFYISYNNYDRADYGGHDTTALVFEDGKSLPIFLILNGNHTEQYSALKEQGFEACYQYFLQNNDQINFRSDKTIEDGQATNRKIMDHINKRRESN